MNNAFSRLNPNIQLVWDASSIKSFQFCPRYYQLNNLQGWQGDNIDLAFGRLLASALERFQKARLDGLTRDDALLVAVTWAMNETYYPATHCTLGVGCDDVGHCYALSQGDEHECGRNDRQWGGRYEQMWKCEGTEKYKNEKGNRAKCPYAFERVWFPGNAPDVCGECGSGIRTERRYVADNDKKNRHTLIRAIVWYGDDQPEELDDGLRPYVFPDGTPAVELSGKMPLPWKTADGERYVLSWNFDYIGLFGSEAFIVDNKTTSKTPNEGYFQTFSPDTQFDTYAMVGTIAYPNVGIKGTLVDAVQLMASGVEFGRHPFYKNDEQHQEHLGDLEWWLRNAEHSARNGYWPMNKRSCWLCPFKRVCSLPPSARDGYLASNFTQGERWDPTRER